MKQSKPLYILISEYLCDLIREHSAESDFKLPSEAQVCRKFQCSRGPVRNAYQLLEKKGYIFRFQGKQTAINPRVKNLLREGDKNTVVAVLPMLNTVFQQNLIAGMEAFCNEKNLALIIMSSLNNPESERKLLQSCTAFNCKGIILYPTDREDSCPEAAELQQENFPIVLIDRKLRDCKISGVYSDHRALLYKTVERLKGRKKIVYVTVNLPFISSVRDRIEGFCSTLQSFGRFDVNENLCMFSDADVDTVERELYNFFSKNRDTDAIIVDNGKPAAILANALKKTGMLEKSLKIALIDNDFFLNPLLQKLNPLIVLQDAREIGYQAAELLYAQMNGNFKREEIVLPIRIKSAASLKRSAKLY